MYLSICLYVCPSMYLSINVSVYLSIYLSIYVSIYLSIYLSMYLSINVSVYLTIYLSIYPSTHLCIYLSITLTLSHSPFLFLCLVSNSYPTFFTSSFIPYLRFEISFFFFLFLSFPLYFFSLSTGMTGAQIERARAKERGHAVIGDVLLRFVQSCTLSVYTTV